MKKEAERKRDVSNSENITDDTQNQVKQKKLTPKKQMLVDYYIGDFVKS